MIKGYIQYYLNQSTPVHSIKRIIQASITNLRCASNLPSNCLTPEKQTILLLL